MNKTIAILPLLAAALLSSACQAQPAATSAASTTAAATELPLVLTASGYVDYAMKGADCTSGNAAKKGDIITLTDPSGKVVDTSKLVDAFPVTGKDGSKRCSSSFGLNAARPTDGDYTITLGDRTMKAKATDMTQSITWTID